MRKLLVLLFIATSIWACQHKTVDPNEVTTYSGPIVTGKHVETRYSDSSILRVIMKAPLQYEYQSGDREFPHGLHIDFFDEKGVFTSTLDCRYARYDRINDIYIAIGEVVINNRVEHKKLETEELKWHRVTKRVFTDKFVKITTPKELLTGQGLEAAQDFSTYRIVKPVGTAQSSSEADIL